jgi:hypothetical protein
LSKGAAASVAAGGDSGNVYPIDGGAESKTSTTSTHPSLGRRPYTLSLPDNSSEASVNRDIDSFNRQDSTVLKPTSISSKDMEMQMGVHQLEMPESSVHRAHIRTTGELMGWTGSLVRYTDTSEIGSPVVKGEEERKPNLLLLLASDVVWIF